MKILNLTEDSKLYTSNVYLGTGNWNTMSDMNTLIDVGRDPSVIEKIYKASTGVGKHKVEQIILTHSHYDHTGILNMVKKEFNSVVLAYSKSLDGVDIILNGGEMIRIGDLLFEVIYAPGHSNDSICLYNGEEKILFAGDSPIVVNSADGKYEDAFITIIEKLVKLPIETIYLGHGNPISGKCNEVLKNTLGYITA